MEQDAQDLAPGLHPVPRGHVAAVVTYLEMAAPPAGPPPSCPEGVALHRVSAPEPAAYLRLFREVGADWLWFSRLRLSARELAAELSAPGVEVHVARRGGQEVGLMELDFRAAPVAELAFFGLTGAAAGQGLGRWMMGQALASAWDAARAVPITRLTVHTCTLDSPAALPFYLRAGFRATARAVEVAPDPRLTGHLPRSAAPQVPILR